MNFGHYIGDPQGRHAHLPMLIRWCFGPLIAPFISEHSTLPRVNSYYISLNNFCDLKVA